MRSITAVFLIVALKLIAWPAVAQQQTPNLEEVMKAMGAMLGGGTNAAAVVDFRELKALLPAELPGLKRKSASGEKNSAIGMTVAVAEGQYESEDGASSITIKISDLGGTGAVRGFMQYGWASAEVDRESDTGYERTITIGGHKAMEKYDREMKTGETQVMVESRFMVEIDGSGVSPEKLQAAVSAIDMTKLAALKSAPATPAPAPAQ